MDFEYCIYCFQFDSNWRYTMYLQLKVRLMLHVTITSSLQHL